MQSWRMRNDLDRSIHNVTGDVFDSLRSYHGLRVDSDVCGTGCNPVHPDV